MSNADKIKKWLDDARGGYTIEQLQKAFDQVKDVRHWKNDIDATVDQDMEAILSVAIPWFTGGGSIDFTKLPDGKMLVQAPGYWSNGMDG